MNKGLEALKHLGHDFEDVFNKYKEIQDTKNAIKSWDIFFPTFEKGLNIIRNELLALEIISQNFRLVGNCLHAKNKYAENGWVFVKEIENEEELKTWKEVLNDE